MNRPGKSGEATPTVCMACFVARRPPVDDTPHGCPGSLIIGWGTDVRTELCACPELAGPDAATAGTSAAR